MPWNFSLGGWQGRRGAGHVKGLALPLHGLHDPAFPIIAVFIN